MRDLTPEDVAVLDKTACKAAARYARRVFWASIDDLKQEALLAAVEAAKRWYDPSTGVPLSAYAWRACVLHLRNWCWRNGSPVSAPSTHTVAELRGLHRRSWEAKTHGARSLIETHAGPVAVEDLYYDAEWNALVRDQVRFLIEERMPEAEKHIAVRVLIDDEEQQAVAEDLGMPKESVWRISRRARVLLAENEMLFNFWKERTR